MSTDQSRALCAAIGLPADEPVGSEPRYVAVMRCFDAEAADAAINDHNERARAERPPIPVRGKPMTAVQLAKGGAR